MLQYLMCVIGSRLSIISMLDYFNIEGSGMEMGGIWYGFHHQFAKDTNGI